MSAQIADGKGALGADPKDSIAVDIVLRHSVMRFDITLVHHRGIELTLDNDIGSGETSLDIAAGKTNMASDVGWRILLLWCSTSAKVFMEDR